MSGTNNKTCKKIHMIILQYPRKSGDKEYAEITTAKHLVTRTVMVDTTVNPGP